jgi:hypothetical protein
LITNGPSGLFFPYFERGQPNRPPAKNRKNAHWFESQACIIRRTRIAIVLNLNRKLWFATASILVFVAAWGQPCIFGFWDRLWNPVRLTRGTGAQLGGSKFPIGIVQYGSAGPTYRAPLY